MVCEDCKEYQNELIKLRNKQDKNNVRTKVKYKFNGYTLFFAEKRPEIGVKISLDGRRNTDSVREIGKMWRNLSIEEKELYNLRAKEIEK